MIQKSTICKTILSGLFAFTTTAIVHANSVPEINNVQSSGNKPKHIKNVEHIVVTVPSHNVPSLPYQVWVTYSDGSHEWRQAMWTNSRLATEREQADPTLNPNGKTYTIGGYIIGDNTTDKGYPITATVKVNDDLWLDRGKDAIAETLPLTDVQIKGHNRLTNNRDLDINALLALDITQQLYNYRDTYGLSKDGYKESDGWDSPTTKLKGHGSGHYMSALAFAYASATDAGKKEQLFDRIERMVNELRECQERTFVWDSTLNRYWEARDYAPEAELVEMHGTWEAFDEYKKDYKHYGYGYLNAIPAAHPALIECYRPYNNEEGVWAPYYTIHKQLAGLIDIANVMRTSDGSNNSIDRRAGHLTQKQLGDKAFLIAKDMGLWVWNRLHYRTYVSHEGNKAQRLSKPGNRYEMWNMYIAGEVGGMAESMARLSEMTCNPEESARLLEGATYFESPAFFWPLSHNIDDIRTRHANQHIPMIIGALRTYSNNKKQYYYDIASNFWNMVQGRYAYAPGGVGNGEMFRQPYSQILSMNTSVQSDGEKNMYPNPDINETCCAYNLAKLTKDLNCYEPDNAKYMDYYERVLYNQLVGSVRPDVWAVTYQYAVGMNAIKPFGNETPQSTCCGGTGVENHVKYQEATYFANDSTLWVALYLPTDLQWKKKGVTISQDCEWPAESSKIRISRIANRGTRFAMKLRVPYWATENFDIKLNGVSIADMFKPSSYAEIAEREWKEGDEIEVIMPFTKHIFWGPDKMSLAATGKNEIHTPFSPQWVGALMYGPLVMATSDIHFWKDAEFEVTTNLDEVSIIDNQETDGTGGKLYTLELNGKRFTPDYVQLDSCTHYLRINQTSGVKKKTSKKIDKSELKEILAIAHERKATQEAWNKMENKVPKYAPWAPYGYARLMEQTANAEKVLATNNKKLTQTEINDATSELNMAVNTMRPGNLAEPEDLNELLELLEQAKSTRNKTEAFRHAIKCGEMVVGYVNDGSGTQDLIDKATKRLKYEIQKIRKRN